MAETLHSKQTSNHILESWTYINAASRNGASGFTSSDIGRIAYQLDTGVYYRLTATTPTWVAVSNNTAVGAAGGDLTGTYPNPIVKGLRGTPIADVAPSDGDYIKYNSASGTYMPTPNKGMLVFGYAGGLIVQSGQQRIYNRFPQARIIKEVFISVSDAPFNNSLIVDVNQDGTTIFGTQAHRPTIASGTFTGVTTSIDTATWVTGSYLTADIDQIGALVAGADLTVQVIFV